MVYSRPTAGYPKFVSTVSPSLQHYNCMHCENVAIHKDAGDDIMTVYFIIRHHLCYGNSGVATVSGAWVQNVCFLITPSTSKNL